MADKNGDRRYYRRLSGPLKAGQTVLYVEANQFGKNLDDRAVEQLKAQLESFLATLKNDCRIQIPDDILIRRLLEQTVQETFGRLLKGPSGYADWMIRAWIAEAKYLYGRLPPRHPQRPTLRQLVERLYNWSDNLNFSHRSEFGPGSDLDWEYVAVHARLQAETIRRLESVDSAGRSSRSRNTPQPLFAKLKNRIKSEGCLLIVGGEENAELLDACAALVGPSVEWVSCRPNDPYQAAVRQRLTCWDAKGVLIVPAVARSLAADLEKFCRVSGKICVVLDQATPEEIEAALKAMEAQM